MSKSIKTCTLNVSGTHCHSCELLIEKEIQKIKGVTSVSASTKDQKVTIQYQNKPPQISELNKMFKDSNYIFSNTKAIPNTKTDPYGVALASLAIIGLYYLVQKLGLFSAFNVSTDSATPAFFIFGLLAGFSTCAALVGGIVLSLSRRGISSVVSFNIGRLIIFTILGGILGFFGSFFRLSIVASSIITIAVCLIMAITALQMLGVKFANNISLALPKSFTSNFADDSKFGGTFLPAIMGGLTFFLPCGFTLTTQSLALASGNWLAGALTMMFFALGTFIPLMIIGITGVKSRSNPVQAKYFSQIAGVLILVFAIYSITAQFNVLGVGVPLVGAQNNQTDIQVVGGKQVIKMSASSSGYSPSTFTIKAGQPVRWEITDQGTSGCTNAVISRTLFDGPINLVPGTTSVREFTAPTTPGTYRFSCWMGMISGSITVVE